MTPEGDLILRRLPGIRAVAIDVANNLGGKGRAQQLFWLADSVEDYVRARELGVEIGQDAISAAMEIVRMLSITPFTGRITRLANHRPGPARYRIELGGRRDGAPCGVIEGTIDRLAVLLDALARVKDEPIPQCA